ncbi:hypothetical protein EG329_014364 [Mollisiaceae sp. DMI_Dod_QoI]|nr:hypothetical protein EG329_014364 [Helotiales sp. DMI_Dod_QoI]
MYLTSKLVSTLCNAGVADNPKRLHRPRLLHSALRLIKALESKFQNHEIAIPSRDIKKTRKGVEIVILYRLENKFFDDIASFLSATATELKLEYKNFVKQDEGITRYFYERQIGNIESTYKPQSKIPTEDELSKAIKKVKEYEGFQNTTDFEKSLPATERATQLGILRRHAKYLHEKEGEELKDEILRMMDTCQATKELPKTGWQIFTWLAGGLLGFTSLGAIVTFVGTAWLTLCVIAAYVSVGAAIATGGLALIVIAGIVGGLYLTLKGAQNVLLVVNETKLDIVTIGERIKNGERVVATPKISPADPNGEIVYGGFFVYTKTKVLGQSAGTYGSAFGLSFRGGQGDFSVGMDCPNSFFGGTNSIEVCTGNEAHKAADMATGSGCRHGWTSQPQVDAKCASKWGNVNWGRVIAMGN